MTTADPPWLAAVPDKVLDRRSGLLSGWLHERHMRPTLAQIEAERARRAPKHPQKNHTTKEKS